MDFKKLLNKLYSLCGAIALFSGAVIFIMMVIGIIIGGEAGAEVMLNAKSLSVWVFRLGSTAILIGFILMLVTGYRSPAMSLKKDESSGDS